MELLLRSICGYVFVISNYTNLTRLFILIHQFSSHQNIVRCPHILFPTFDIII
jgi:hypothetical protein